MRILIVMCSFWLVACGPKTDILITQKPITFDANREALSVQYLKERHGISQENAKINPTMVVVHWTVTPTFDETFDAFNPSELPRKRDGIRSASSLNVSAHFLIDRDGSIFQLLPTDTFARHVIGLNYTAIGIENVADGKALPLTHEQITANINLINFLSETHQIDYVIGHHEYKQFIGTELWKETDPNYLTDKNDPGDSNIRRIRVGLARLDLKPLPIYTVKD